MNSIINMIILFNMKINKYYQFYIKKSSRFRLQRLYRKVPHTTLNCLSTCIYIDATITITIYLFINNY